MFEETLHFTGVVPAAAAAPVVVPHGWANLEPLLARRGPTHDGRIKPDVCGPGSQVMSAGNSVSLDPNTENCSAVYKDGTSSANAIVAGAAVLIRQYFMKGYYPNGVKKAFDRFPPPAALLKAILINSGQALWSPNKDGVVCSYVFFFFNNYSISFLHDEEAITHRPPPRHHHLALYR